MSILFPPAANYLYYGASLITNAVNWYGDGEFESVVTGEIAVDDYLINSAFEMFVKWLTTGAYNSVYGNKQYSNLLEESYAGMWKAPMSGFEKDVANGLLRDVLWKELPGIIMKDATNSIVPSIIEGGNGTNNVLGGGSVNRATQYQNDDSNDKNSFISNYKKKRRNINRDGKLQPLFAY